MNRIILSAIRQALKLVAHKEYFRDERSYQVKLCSVLEAALGEYGVLDGEALLVAEYQKRFGRHGTRLRPDIILHIPAEPNASVRDNNFAVFALKRRANATRAKEDFDKLDEMFSRLNYPLGIFINIDSKAHHLSSYEGEYGNRLYAFAVQVEEERVCVVHAYIIRGKVVEEEF